MTTKTDLLGVVDTFEVLLKNYFSVFIMVSPFESKLNIVIDYISSL